MIYAKDLVLGDLRKEKGQVFSSFFNKIKLLISKNKMITWTIVLCTILMGLDFVLIQGFIKLLQTL